MKIAVVGCGAVGSYYGAMLCRAGHEVHFLLRSDYEVVRRQGVEIHGRSVSFRSQPFCAKSPAEIGVSDLVVIALKATANDQFARLLPPLVGPQTALITLQNGLGNEEQLARIFGPEQILGGLCFVCLNRIAPGVIHHLDHGLIILGEFGCPLGARTRQLAAVLETAGVTCNVTDNLARTHWEKLVWNVPFNGLGVASAAGYDALVNSSPKADVTRGPCLTSDKLLAEERWVVLVRELMDEVIATANALGLAVATSLREQQIVRTRSMGAYKASTVLDFEHGRPLELDGLFLEPLRLAQRCGVATPRLRALCSVLQQLDSQRPWSRKAVPPSLEFH